MKETRLILLVSPLLVLFSFYSFGEFDQKVVESKLLNYEVDPQQLDLKFYWKDENEDNFANFQNLRSALQEQNKALIFAMNGGMYHKDLTPQGLYIEGGLVKSKIDTAKSGYGNFYMQPNGIFYITKENQPVICTTDGFINNKNVLYATQSGPMLLIGGKIHPKFNPGSSNVHIRNGVGVLPNGHLLFAMSREKINFYDFASYFKQKGCEDALYLDGFVSRAYLPEKDWVQLDGNFGVIIGVIRNVN